MARIRTIKPEFPQSESMGRVSREARLCFILLWTVADDSGRLRGNSRMLASLLYPYDGDAPKLIDKWLSELTKEKCLDRYSIDGNQYIEIRNWLLHQKIDKPSASKFPAFANIREDSSNTREDSSLDRDRDRDQGPGGEGEDSTAPAKFRVPSLHDVSAYCSERGNAVDAQKFLDHYTANGWRVGRNPMRDWKAAVRTWERNDLGGKPAKPAREPLRMPTPEELANYNPAGGGA